MANFQHLKSRERKYLTVRKVYGMPVVQKAWLFVQQALLIHKMMQKQYKNRQPLVKYPIPVWVGDHKVGETVVREGDFNVTFKYDGAITD